jgi:hypothetical protein
MICQADAFAEGATSWMKHWKHYFQPPLIAKPRVRANPTWKNSNWHF